MQNSIFEQTVVPIGNGNLVCLTFPSQYLQASTLMRPQEFYESPFPEIRDHYFSREQFEDVYASNNKNFTYHQDWVGFNIPGHSLRKFFFLFNDLNKKEILLKSKLSDYLLSSNSLYIASIIHGQKEVFFHEFAHALFYLDARYAETVTRAVLELKLLQKSQKWLKEKGYAKEVFLDETHAYCVTRDADFLNGTKIKKKETTKFRDAFLAQVERLKIDKFLTKNPLKYLAEIKK